MDPDSRPLASFPNLESLEFHGCNRQYSSRSPHSEWCFVVPAVTRNGEWSVCLLSSMLTAGAQVGQHPFGGCLGASVARRAARAATPVSRLPVLQQACAPAGPLPVAQKSLMQGWRQQGLVLLCMPTGRTHHTAVQVQGSAGAPRGPCLPHQQGMLSPCNVCHAAPARLSCRWS